MRQDEEGFARLKGELNLNFEFHSIESKLISLLHQCISADQDNERNGLSNGLTNENFIVKLILTNNSNEAEVRFVKNDSFREIPMFSLNIRAGNDRSIKQFLANEISRLKNDNGQFQQTNRILSEDLQRKSEESQKLIEKINEMKLIYQNRINEMKNEHTTTLSDINISHSKEKESIFKDCEVQRKIIEEEYKKQIRELNKKIDELIAENKSIRDRNLGLENENHTLSQTQMKDLDSNQLQIVSLNQKVKDKEDIVQQLQVSLDDTKDRCRVLEKTNSSFEYEIQKVKDKYEEQSRQLQKANEIIVKLDSTIRLNKQQFKEYKTRVSEKEQQAKKLAEKIGKLESKLRATKEKYSHQLNEVSQLNSEHENHIEQLNQQIEQLEKQKNDLNNEQMRLQKAMYEMVKQNDQKEKEVAKYTSFTSNFSPPPKSSFTPSVIRTTPLKSTSTYTSSQSVPRRISPETDDSPYRPLYETYKSSTTPSRSSDLLPSSSASKTESPSSTLSSPTKQILFNQGSTPSKFSI